MSIMKKVSYIAIIIILIGFSCMDSKTVYATGDTSISSEIDKFKASTVKEKSVKSLTEVANKFLSALRVASALLLVIVVASSGIRYIVASADVKGEIKKTALPVILGLILIFGASNLAALIIEIFGK